MRREITEEMKGEWVTIVSWRHTCSKLINRYQAKVGTLEREMDPSVNNYRRTYRDKNEAFGWH